MPKTKIMYRLPDVVFLFVCLVVVVVCVCVCGGGGVCLFVCVCVRLPCLYFRGPSYDSTTTHRGLYTFRGPQNGSSQNIG